jgi:phenylacetate-CoA ligase
VSTVCELRTAEMADRIEAALGRRPFDVYWTTEAGILGLECEQHRLHAIDDELLFEVVDEDNRPVAPTEQGHRVLITNFARRAQPLIRYEIDDMVTVSPETCPCGRPFPVLTSIEGRSDEVLYLAGRAGGQVPVHPAVFRGSLAAERAVREYEVIQREGEIVIRIRPDSAVDGGPLRQRVASRLQQELASAAAVPPQLRVELVDEIRRDPRKMSKLKLVRSEVR